MVFEAFKVIIDAQSLLFSFCHLEKPKLKLYGQGQVILLGLYCSYFIVFSRYYDKLYAFQCYCILIKVTVGQSCHLSCEFWVVMADVAFVDIAMTSSFVHKAGRIH